MTHAPIIPVERFFEADIRIGTIVSAQPNARAKKPAYVLTIDFGAELGTKTTSAQLTGSYAAEALLGRQVAAVINFPVKQIAGVASEVLVLAAVETGDEGRTVLLRPDVDVDNGARIR